jgi:hypothetical protein
MTKEVIVASREQSTMVSLWTEFLCLERMNDDRVVLAVKQHSILGQCSDFEDEETGDINLPDTIDGHMVIGCEDDFVIGEPLVICSQAQAFDATNASCHQIQLWLASVWDGEDEALFTKVQGLLQVWRK